MGAACSKAGLLSMKKVLSARKKMLGFLRRFALSAQGATNMHLFGRYMAIQL